MGRLVGWPSQPPEVPQSWLRLWASPTSLSWTDRQTVLPREATPSGRRGLGPLRCLCQPVCIPSSRLTPASPWGQAYEWGEDCAFLYTLVCMPWREAVQCSGYLFTCRFL